MSIASAAGVEQQAACKVAHDLTRLDRALPHVAQRLQAHEPLTIVAIGSSSTAGAGASSPAASYPSRLEAELRERFPSSHITVINRGVNGEVASDMIARFDHDVLPEKPDLVLWQVGSNSVLRDSPIDPEGGVIRAGVDKLKQGGSDVVLINPQFAPKMLAKRDTDKMIELIDRTAKAVNVNVFRRFAVMRDWYESRGLSFDMFVTSDGLHMNDWGYGCWAKLLSASIAEAATRPTTTAGAAPGLTHAPTP